MENLNNQLAIAEDQLHRFYLYAEYTPEDLMLATALEAILVILKETVLKEKL